MKGVGMIILDTNVISEFAREHPDPRVCEWMASQLFDDLYISSISVAEMTVGVKLMPDGRKRRALEAFVTEVLLRFNGKVLPFDMNAGLRYASVQYARRNVGRPIGVQDAQIAAIARVHDGVVATRNIKDFEDTGVALVNPWK